MIFDASDEGYKDFIVGLFVVLPIRSLTTMQMVMKLHELAGQPLSDEQFKRVMRLCFELRDEGMIVHRRERWAQYGAWVLAVDADEPMH